MSHKIIDGDGLVKYVFSIGAGTVGDPYRLVLKSHTDAVIDSGLAFRHMDTHSVANTGNNTFYYLLKTPASPAHIEILGLEFITTSAPVNIFLHENSIVSANGTSETLYNLNRQSTTAASTLLYINPTVSSLETELLSMVIPGDKSIGSMLNEGYRTILKASTNYLIKIENISGASANISIGIVIGED